MTNIICCQPAICLATYVVFLKYVISNILVIKQIGISLAIGNTHHDCITVYTIDLSSKIVFDLLRSFVCNSFVYNPGYSGNVSPCDFKIRKGDLMGSHDLVDLAVGSEVAYNLCVGVR